MSCLPYPGDGAPLDELVSYYVQSGYTWKEVLGVLLLVHNVCMSRRTLNRIKKRLNLRRRENETPLPIIVNQLLFLRSRGYDNIGYRAMWTMLNTSYGLNVKQETIRTLLKIIDRDGVVRRSRRRLVRRSYYSPGPNYCLHIDGYDKLKPYGISIHGCVDGFSRKVLWLSACSSNKNPRIVANFFIDYLKKIKRVPTLIRTDAGTENVLIHRIQRTLRHFHTDGMAGERSVSIGRSTANQRIEMLWSFLMRHFTIFWRSLFMDMIEQGLLNNADPLQLECLRFCFLPLIQKHLDTFKDYWNKHRVRNQPTSDGVFDIPDVMFYQPLMFGKQEMSLSLPCNIRILDEISNRYLIAFSYRGCSENFRRVVENATHKTIDEFDAIETPQEAKMVFRALVSDINIYSQEQN